MEKGCDPYNYSLVTVKGNAYSPFTLPTNSPALESVKSIIIFIALSAVLLIGLSLLPKSPVGEARYQYQYQYMQPQ